MSDLADAEKRIEEHVERVVGRAVLKIGLVGMVSALLVGATAVWRVKGWVDEIEMTLKAQSGALAELDPRLKAATQALECCVLARAKVDETTARLDGHLRPDPKEPRR